MKTKRLPVLDRIEEHQNGRRVPVYKLVVTEIDEKGQPIWKK